MSNTQRIVIDLDGGYKLVAEQNEDPYYNKEIFVGILDPDGVWHQDLAVIRSAYQTKNNETVWKNDLFDVLVYADKDCEDYTDNFAIGLYREEDEEFSRKVKHLDLREANALKVGDKVLVYCGVSGLKPATVTREMFWNSDADEPAWEIETTNGFVDGFSVYQEVL